jgi:hypothetical protein
MSSDLTDSEIHDHPDYQTVEEVCEKINEIFSRQTSDGAVTSTENLINATINNEVLAHLAGHRVMELAQRYVPPQLMGLVVVGIIRAYVEAFMTGAHYQARKDAEFISFDVPDFFPTPEEPRPAADPEQVKAVQGLPQEERRNLFKSFLKKQDDDSAPASE